jgi:hypothetical protein
MQFVNVQAGGAYDYIIALQTVISESIVKRGPADLAF